MTDYDVLILKTNSPEVIEQLGSKPKFWFRMPDDEQPWLFKFTRINTGEDWSEKIASEVAHLLEIPAAQIKLATFMDKRGCASRSFVETRKDIELFHGSEVLAGRVLGYQKTKQWHQSDHCIQNIISAVEATFPEKQRRTEQLLILAGFIVLDAIICNTDRHHDNWGLLRGLFAGKKTVHSVAPSFDHASSLGRELGDEKRRQILDTTGIEKYAKKGRGGIYWDCKDEKSENPLTLAVKSAQKYPKYFQPWIEKLQQVDFKDIAGIVERIPVELMSKEAREFSLRLMTYTIKQLKEATL